jgi:hypothetical protein
MFANSDEDADSMYSSADALSDMIILQQDSKESLHTIKNTGIYANSVNVYVGKPRSGKTFSAIRDIINVIRNDVNVNALIYINESGQIDDDTFKNFQCLITVPIVCIPYADADNYLHKITEYKQYYNQIKERHLESQCPKEYSEDIFNVLNINNFDLSHLHTLVLLEDATNSKSIRNPNSFVNDLLVRCAHTQLSFFILIHYWKALTTNVKANLSSIRIFPGYSPQQLSYMLYQMNVDANAIKQLYYTLDETQHNSIFIDTILSRYCLN